MKGVKFLAVALLLLVLGFIYSASVEVGIGTTMAIGLLATFKTKGFDLKPEQEEFITQLEVGIDGKLQEKAAEIEKLQGEIKAVNESLVKRDEADRKNQEALDKLIADRDKTKLEEKSLTLDQLLENALTEKTDQFEKYQRKEIKSFDLEIDLKAVGAVSTGNVTGSTNWGALGRTGIIMNPNTMTHVRSLINVIPSDAQATDYYFMRENGAGEGAPAATAEGAEKPQFDVDLVESSVKFETIAGWMLVSNKAMRNIKGFAGYLNSRLPEKLLDAEDAQILYGTGVSPQIKGILTAGNFTAGSAAGATVLAEKIINDLSLLEDTHKRKATGIALRPADYYGFFKNKAAGSGEYDLPAGFNIINGVLYILGIPVATTTALTTNDYVVGDFRNGTDLIVQEAMRIEFFREDGTNVRTNQTTVRIEETVALPVYGSNYFIKGSSALA